MPNFDGPRVKLDSPAKIRKPNTGVLPPPGSAEDNRRRARLNIKDDATGRVRVDGLKTPSSEGVNPKDKIGASKLDFSLIPTSAKVQLALALMDGATKYGPYNWRVEPVQILTYLAAAERHLESFKEGEDTAADSLVHHLGHVMACCSILIDAISQGTVIDNRPINGQGAKLIAEANNMIKNEKPEGWGR